MLEFKTLVLSLLDPSIQQTLQQFERDGWIPVPGVPPQAIYVICRQVGQAQQPMMAGAGFGALEIDESKMYFIDKDGNRVDRH